jgi:hypothetical protein
VAHEVQGKKVAGGYLQWTSRIAGVKKDSRPLMWVASDFLFGRSVAGNSVVVLTSS